MPPNGIVDDGLEDLIGVIKTRLPDAGQFVHIVASIESGESAPSLALYINGALASPLDDGETGLFKDESLVGQGTSFVPVGATAGQNPLPTRMMTADPSLAAIAIGRYLAVGPVRSREPQHRSRARAASSAAPAPRH